MNGTTILKNTTNFHKLKIDIGEYVAPKDIYFNKLNKKIKITKSDSLIDINNLYVLKYYKNNDDLNDYLLFSINNFSIVFNRLHVVLYVNEIKTGLYQKVEYYTSISDGSFWRICVKSDPNGYEKGYDYLTTTFININLQKFIDESKNSYIIQNNIPFSCIELKKLNTNDFLYKRLIGLENKYDSNDYISSNTFFKIFDICFETSNYLTQYKYCIENLLEFLKQNEKNNSQMSIEKTQENINILSDIYCTLKKFKVYTSKNISNNVFSSSRLFYINFRDAISQLFTKYFNIDVSSKKYIYDKTFNVDEFNFACRIFSFEITSKINTDEIFIVNAMEYCSYNFEAINSMGLLKIILNIVPKKTSTNTNNVMTIYGLDECYVATGCIINKIFEYTEQIKFQKIHDNSTKKIYTFIGDLSNYSFIP